MAKHNINLIGMLKMDESSSHHTAHKMRKIKHNSKVQSNYGQYLKIANGESSQSSESNESNFSNLEDSSSSEES